MFDQTIFLFLGYYLIFAGLQFWLAQTLKHESPSLAFFPLLNLLQIFDMGKQKIYPIIIGVCVYFLAGVADQIWQTGPLVEWGAILYIACKMSEVYAAIAQRCERSRWFGVLMLVPVLHLWVQYELISTLRFHKIDDQIHIQEMLELLRKGKDKKFIAKHFQKLGIEEERFDHLMITALREFDQKDALGEWSGPSS